MAESIKSRSRILVGSSAVLLVLALGVVVLWLGRGVWLSRTESPAPRTDTGASARDRSRSTRDQARAAVRTGRLDEAFAAYRVLEPDGLEAEDFWALGSSLLERDRLVLGWAALEAARRVDPKHAPTARALDDLQGKLTVSAGQAALRLRAAADAVEFLGSVRGGPPLGMLVLGLARYAGDPGREQDFLDRLLIRDRAVLRAVRTTADAIKLVARLLMETSRPVAATDLLRPLVAQAGRGRRNPQPPADPPADSAGADREAAWLLSRAALQLGHDEAADALLAQAAGFGKEDHPPPEPAPFVGSRRCAACHSTIYREQQRDSSHAQTLYRGSNLKEVPLPAGPVPDPVVPGLTHRFTRRADDRIALESRVHDQVVQAVIRYAVGSGRHGITMVAKDEQGVDRLLRISYFGADQTWGETKGISFLPHDPLDSLGLRLAPKSLRECLHCHTTWFRAADPLPTVPPGPEAHDQGIGCERCHGPGLNHIKAVESGFAQLAIAQTSHTPPLQLLQSCSECHASKGSVEPNDPEFTRVQGTTLLFSRCFTGSQGRIHCATCHDPHRSLDPVLTHYEAKCLACHPAPALPPDASSRPSVTATRGPAQSRPPACPVNPATGCISCHMPKVADPSRRARFTDHHIRVHRRPGAGAG